MSGLLPPRRVILAGTIGLLVTRLPRVHAQQAVAKLRVVVVGGHPGDAEYGCGGTIARYIGRGSISNGFGLQGRAGTAAL